jgi:hypothetical protein
MRKLMVIAALVLIGGIAYAAELTDYETIAIASPLITQIYTNPEISKNEDLELQPETQIALYEKLSDDICRALKGKYMNKIGITCFNEIQSKLSQTDWNDFNRLFTGKDAVEKDLAVSFGNKLGVDAVLDSYLMFSYYNNSNGKRHLEAHFEWYLIDLVSGEATVTGKYDYSDEFKEDSDILQNEMKCVNSIVKAMAD